MAQWVVGTRAVAIRAVGIRAVAREAVARAARSVEERRVGWLAGVEVWVLEVVVSQYRIYTLDRWKSIDPDRQCPE